MKTVRKVTKTQTVRFMDVLSFVALTVLVTSFAGCSLAGGSNKAKAGDIPMPEKTYPVGMLLDNCNVDKDRCPKEGTVVALSGEVLGDISMPKPDDNSKYNRGNMAISGDQNVGVFDKRVQGLYYAFVTCKFLKADAEAFAALKDKQKVVIKGIRDEGSTSVDLYPCQLVKVEP